MSEQKKSQQLPKWASTNASRAVPIAQDDWRTVDGRPLDDIVARYDESKAAQDTNSVITVSSDVVIMEPSLSSLTDDVVAADGPMIIDGVATLVERVVPGAMHPAISPADAAPPILTGQQDDIIIATLDDRHLTINAGGTAHYRVNLINNGPTYAIFTLEVEGDIENGWITVDPNYVQLTPGGRAGFDVEIKPPRNAKSKAGSRSLSFIVSGSEYPDRRSVVNATLVIAPFHKIHLGQLQPRQLQSRGRGTDAKLMIPLTNQGNGAATIRLQATERLETRAGDRSSRQDQRCSFEFYDPENQANGFGQIQVTLQAGEETRIPLRIEPHVQPLLGFQAPLIPFRVIATITGQNRTPHEVQGELLNQPLLSSWQLASLTGFSLLTGMVLFLGVLTLGAFLWLNNSRTEAAASQPLAPVAIIIKVAEPVPTSAGNSRPLLVVPNPQNAIAAIPNQASAVESLPVQLIPGGDRQQPIPPTPILEDSIASIQPISAPTSVPSTFVGPAPVGLPPARPTPARPTPMGPTGVAPIAIAPTPVIAVSETPSGPLTYELMFQEIAAQYDLDWRMLAAQAYVESSFDPNAVGRDGDMGLMQIIPTTWREWAPRVNAEDPFDSYSNAFVAATYLDYLRTQLDKRGYTDPKWMLVAYNWGPGNVFNFIAEGKSWDALDAKRKQYADKILRITDSIPE